MDPAREQAVFDALLQEEQDALRTVLLTPANTMREVREKLALIRSEITTDEIEGPRPNGLVEMALASLDADLARLTRLISARRSGMTTRPLLQSAGAPLPHDATDADTEVESLNSAVRDLIVALARRHADEAFADGLLTDGQKPVQDVAGEHPSDAGRAAKP